LDEVVGQSHILGENGLLRRILRGGHIPNMVFYGPSGTGKTTVANLIAAGTNRRLHTLNATSAGLADIRAILAELDTMFAPGGVLLYLDEIQYFNKKQQQSLLEFMEDGRLTLIAATTENPYFYVFGALLSRSTVFEFKPLTPPELRPALNRAVEALSGELGTPVTLEDGVSEHLRACAGGDVRRMLTALELLCAAAPPGEQGILLTLEDAQRAVNRAGVRYDRDGDAHYDLLSAYQKSMRGSDPDAAVHYLARLLAAGDLPSACRRLLVTAAEDVGLAYPQILPIVKACVDSAQQLGLPEAMMPLSAAVILVATAPKSNSASAAIGAAMADLQAGHSGDVPANLKDSHYGGASKLGHGLSYEYPHGYPDHYVAQQYLPDALKGAKYYEYGGNKSEQAFKAYWEKVKKG
jgi:putative ATPase